ncbi:putative aspartic proteinase nepenthesin-2-like [Capsicum annuum]|nr:putative aspartic proteinase nepenthesin-2-like [Capsicum annuum]KAF3661952.1 putative aspartic proteinase nepenthesin-2-like [Capsicum annuum]
MNILFHPLTPLMLWNMSIDPTKLLDPPMPSYTLTIYNLYLFEKSKFKDYDSLLGNRFTSWQARANHLASVLENGDAISANGTLVRPHDEHESEVDNKNVPVTSAHFIGQAHPGSNPGALVKVGAASAPQPMLMHLLHTEQVKSYLLIDTGSDLVW